MPHTSYWKKLLQKINIIYREARFSFACCRTKRNIHWKYILWLKYVPYIFSIDIFEKFAATLQFRYFLTCSYSQFCEVLRRRKVIFLMGILMVAMTASNRDLARMEWDYILVICLIKLSTPAIIYILFIRHTLYLRIRITLIGLERIDIPSL